MGGENVAEVVGAVESHLIGDLLAPHVGSPDELFGGANAHVSQVGAEGGVQMGLEYSREGAGAHGEAGAEVFQGQRGPHVVGFDVSLSLFGGGEG